MSKIFKYISYLFVILTLSCSEDTQSPDGKMENSPLVNSVNPSEGLPGIVVTIIGDNFDTTNVNNNTVKFNGVESQIVHLEEQKIGAIVPFGATAGHIEVEVNNISVMGPYFDVIIPNYPINTIVSTISEISEGRIYSIAINEKGEVFVSGQTTSLIYKLNLDGTFTIVAGSETGFLDEQALEAKFNEPHGINFDQNGNLIVLDKANAAIRKIDQQNRVTTIITGIVNLHDIVINSYGEVFVSALGKTLYKVSTNEEKSSFISFSDNFSGLTIDNEDNIYTTVSDQKIYKISPQGKMAILAGSEWGFADEVGINAKFAALTSITIGPEGFIYVAESGNNLIRRISTSGEVITIAGTGIRGYQDGQGNEAFLGLIMDMEFDEDGNLLLVDWDAKAIRKITFD